MRQILRRLFRVRAFTFAALPTLVLSIAATTAAFSVVDAVALAGIVLGVACSVVATRALAALLFGVRPADPLTLAAASALMLVVSLAAIWLPARRASATDPKDALRSD